MIFSSIPEKLTDIDIAVESACIFWRDNNLSKYADTGDFKNFSSVVNCGKPNRQPNQWAKRNALYSLCKRRVPADFSLVPPLEILHLTETFDQPQVAAPEGNQPEAEPAAPAAPPTTLKEIVTTVFLHTPKDTVQNILTVIGIRVSAGLLTIWSLGLHGKIFLHRAGCDHRRRRRLCVYEIRPALAQLVEIGTRLPF